MRLELSTMTCDCERDDWHYAKCRTLTAAVLDHAHHVSNGMHLYKNKALQVPSNP